MDELPVNESSHKLTQVLVTTCLFVQYDYSLSLLCDQVNVDFLYRVLGAVV